MTFLNALLLLLIKLLDSLEDVYFNIKEPEKSGVG